MKEEKKERESRKRRGIDPYITLSLNATLLTAEQRLQRDGWRMERRFQLSLEAGVYR